MGEPGCWRRPPSRSEPVSIDANPISSMSFATAAFAAASSPAMKRTSRSSFADREPLAKVLQPIVLKAFTRRAAGIRFATSSRCALAEVHDAADGAVGVHRIDHDFPCKRFRGGKRVHLSVWN